jgi:hypothetical protein
MLGHVLANETLVTGDQDAAVLGRVEQVLAIRGIAHPERPCGYDRVTVLLKQ